MRKKDVIKHFHTAVNVTKALGLHSSGTVSMWSEIIPEKQALRLERITDGVLKYDPALYREAA